MTYYDDIYEHAVDNYYLITTKEAATLGVPSVELAKLAYRGKLEHIAHGVYRLVRYVPHENDPYAISVASVGEDAYLFGESVIAMLGLAPTNPARIYVATPHRCRKKINPGIVVVERAGLADITLYNGVRSQRLGSAILACKNKVMDERLRLAADNAYVEGYLLKDEYGRVKEVLDSHETTQ